MRPKDPGSSALVSGNGESRVFSAELPEHNKIL